MPELLIEEISQRADELHLTASDVVRSAVTKELAAPPDPRSRVWVEEFLAGRLVAEGT
ncbi:MAG TPA: hypothetical protein VG963_16270 [Polyangiaceae bacterium]|nr:hypothetical protein [Polyangiaceae bacterium]